MIRKYTDTDFNTGIRANKYYHGFLIHSEVVG